MYKGKEFLYDFVHEKISYKQEGSNWDFKKQWYEKNDKSNLLHDILCMVNLVEHVDGYIIIGVDEENDYSISGVEKDANRKDTNEIVTFLRDKPFAGGHRPVVTVEKLQMENHEIDVIIVHQSNETPYYIDDHAKNCGAIRPFHIYTRVQDTNTPIDKSADPGTVEKLWRKRFGLDQTMLERAFLYLQTPDDWDHIESGYFYKYAPEYTIIKESNDSNSFDFYHLGMCDPTPSWYNIEIRYHQTCVYSITGIGMDGGRYTTVAPDFHLLSSDKECLKGFAFYVKGTQRYILYEFFNEKATSKNDRLAFDRYSRIVPILESPEDKEEFWDFLRERFYDSRKKYNKDMAPGFSRLVRCDQSEDSLKEEYCDQLAFISLYEDFWRNKVGLYNDIDDKSD